MDIHILDYIVYIISIIAIWNFLPEDYTEELGSLIGYTIVIVYTLVYIVVFGVIDYNISDIPFSNLIDINLKL